MSAQIKTLAGGYRQGLAKQLYQQTKYAALSKKFPAYGRRLAEEITQGNIPPSVSVFCSWETYSVVDKFPNIPALVIGESSQIERLNFTCCRGLVSIIACLGHELPTAQQVAIQLIQAGASGTAIAIYEFDGPDIGILRFRGLSGVCALDDQ